MNNPSRMPSVRIFSKNILHLPPPGLTRARRPLVGRKFWLVVTFRLGASVPHDQFSGVVIVLE